MEIGELDIFDLNVGLVNETSQSVWVSDVYQLDSKLIKCCISCLVRIGHFRPGKNKSGMTGALDKTLSTWVTFIFLSAIDQTVN